MVRQARLVQLDRMSAYGADGRRFESCSGCFLSGIGGSNPAVDVSTQSLMVRNPTEQMVAGSNPAMGVSTQSLMVRNPTEQMVAGSNPAVGVSTQSLMVRIPRILQWVLFPLSY